VIRYDSGFARIDSNVRPSSTPLTKDLVQQSASHSFQMSLNELHQLDNSRRMPSMYETIVDYWLNVVC